MWLGAMDGACICLMPHSAISAAIRGLRYELYSLIFVCFRHVRCKMYLNTQQKLNMFDSIDRQRGVMLEYGVWKNKLGGVSC